MYNEYLIHDKKLWVRIEDFLESMSDTLVFRGVKCKDCKHRYNPEECPRCFALNYTSPRTGPKDFRIDNTTDESYCEKGEAKDTDD
jgi:predicted Zn-ribbon and HTH transcriptional regulator